MATRGRPPEPLTPQVQAKIVYALHNAAYRRTAAEYAGISHSTFLRWMRAGASKSKSQKLTPFKEFRRAVLDAEKSSEVGTIAAVLASRDPKHLLDVAARRWPERWGKNTLELKNLVKTVEALKAEVQALRR
jgi:hypothetical protein